MIASSQDLSEKKELSEDNLISIISKALVRIHCYNSVL